MKVCLSCAPGETLVDQLVHVSGMRGPIKVYFPEGIGNMTSATLSCATGAAGTTI